MNEARLDTLGPLRFSVRTDDPIGLAIECTGKVNETFFYGEGPGCWLCCGVFWQPGMIWPVIAFRHAMKLTISFDNDEEHRDYMLYETFDFNQLELDRHE